MGRVSVIALNEISINPHLFLHVFTILQNL